MSGAPGSFTEAFTARFTPRRRSSEALRMRRSKGMGILCRSRRFGIVQLFAATIYEGGRINPERFVPARWDLLPENKYMWASVQTVRGCAKHCSFCSVWRTDGQRPRQRAADTIIEEIVQLRRKGSRFIALADDNFYPVSLTDIAQAKRQGNAGEVRRLESIRAERFELMARLAELPAPDLVFFTQITMEVAEDDAFLAAGKTLLAIVSGQANARVERPRSTSDSWRSEPGSEKPADDFGGGCGRELTGTAAAALNAAPIEPDATRRNRRRDRRDRRRLWAASDCSGTPPSGSSSGCLMNRVTRGVYTFVKDYVRLKKAPPLKCLSLEDSAGDVQAGLGEALVVIAGV